MFLFPSQVVTIFQSFGDPRIPDNHRNCLEVTEATDNVCIVMACPLYGEEILGGRSVLEKFSAQGKRHYLISGSMNNQLWYGDPGEFSQVVEMAGKKKAEQLEKMWSGVSKETSSDWRL